MCRPSKPRCNRASLIAPWRCGAGPPVDGLALDDAQVFCDWLAIERERLLAARRPALEASAAAHEARGDPEAALSRIESLLTEDALQEQHHRDAMRLHAACGRREAALAQYRRCCRLLKDELDLQPMAETEALAATLRRAPPTGPPVAPKAALAPAAPSALLPGQMPFVGRSSEVAALETAWRAGQALLIEGEAGVGKTRLARDFAAAHGPYALVQCRPGDAAVPYAAFTRALRTLAGPTPELSDLPPWVQGELARVMPELGAAPPPMRSQAESSRFIEACTLAWLALAADSFDAVILDDWHHADTASQTLLGCIAQRRNEQGRIGARELLVYRPELDTQATQATQNLRDVAGASHLRLGPLAADAVLALVQHLSGARNPQRFAARLGRATAGIPFFLAETLRHLAELKLLGANADGVWQTPFDEATDDYRELPVPASVHDTVLARVGRLPVAAQRVLEAAALAGEPFSPALLAPSCALSELETVLAIEHAMAARLLREHDEGGYAFTHDLVQQAIEAALPPERRRLVHRRLALGAEAAGAPAATVALHHEASGDARRAVAHRLAAGDAAQRVHALVEAIGHWQQGLAGGPTPSQALALHLRLMPTRLKIDQRLASMHDAQALRELGRSGELSEPERSEAWLAVASHLAHNSHEADALVLLDAPPAALDDRQQAQALAARAMALHGIGQIEASDAAARAALAMPGMQGLERANLLDSMSANEHLAGHIQAALQLSEARVALCMQLGDTHGVIRGMYRRGTFMLDLGESANALLELGKAEEHCERYGFTWMRHGTLYNLACAYTAQGQPALLLATVRRGWALQPPLPLNDLRLLYRLAFVDGHYALGEIGPAWDSAVSAVDEALALGTQLSLAATAKTCVELFATLGEQALPSRLFAAIDNESMRQMPQVAAEMWIARAQAALMLGDVVVARQALAQAPAAEAIESPRESAAGACPGRTGLGRG